MLTANEAGLRPVDPGCGSRDVHIHDVFIENGDDSIVMKQGWPTAEQIPPAGCTRDVLVVGLVRTADRHPLQLRQLSRRACGRRE